MGPDALKALEEHAQAVTKQANAGSEPALPRRLPAKVRSKDLPADVFKLITRRPRTTYDICRFFGEDLVKVEDILRELMKEGFIEIYKLSPTESFWCAIDAARGRTVNIAPPAPLPPPMPKLKVSEWREIRAFAGARGEVIVSVPAEWEDPRLRQQAPAVQSTGSDAQIDAIFSYPMKDIVKASRDEWLRRHPKSPKANPPKGRP